MNLGHWAALMIAFLTMACLGGESVRGSVGGHTVGGDARAFLNMRSERMDLVLVHGGCREIPGTTKMLSFDPDDPWSILVKDLPPEAGPQQFLPDGSPSLLFQRWEQSSGFALTSSSTARGGSIDIVSLDLDAQTASGSFDVQMPDGSLMGTFEATPCSE